MADRLIGVFNHTRGCCAACADCHTPLFVGRNASKVQKAVATHYNAQHPEHKIRFARYHQER